MKERIEAWTYHQGYKKVYVESRYLMERIKKLRDSILSSTYYQNGKIRPIGWDFIISLKIFSKLKKMGNVVNI